MNTQVSTRAFDELTNVIDELEKLTSKPGNLSDRESKRHSFLLAKMAMLRQGVSVGELRNYERDRLMQEMGLAKMPEAPKTRMEQDIENEWRRFARGEEVQSSYVPEVRYAEAGTQSITYTQLIPGGAFVPAGINSRLYQTQKMYDQIFDEQYCNLVETPTGNLTAFPIFDDLQNNSVQIGETLQSSEVDVASLSNTQLGAYTFRSGIVGVSIELLQDANWPLGLVLERVFAMRHARGGGAALATGSGNNAPTGLITGAVAAGATITVAAGSSANDGSASTGTNSIGSADLFKCYYSLNAAYRPGANWAMSDTTLLSISEQLDKQGRPLVSWRKGLTGTDGDIPFILGKPVAICPSMPSIGSGNNSVCFYNSLYFVQRRVPSASYVQRFSQNTSLVLAGLVGFQSYLRMSSALVSGNSSFVPASIIQNHS